LRIQFTITYADGTAAEATASVADQVAFEQAHDRSIARLADDFPHGPHGRRLQHLAGQGRERRDRSGEDRPFGGDDNAHWLIVHLAYEYGLAPSAVLAESDRMIFTMSKYLAWRAQESRRS